MNKSIPVYCIFITILMGCGTTTAYRPAKSDSDFGYQDRNIGSNEYWIGFLGSPTTDLSVVDSHWNTRANELCKGLGYKVAEYQNGLVERTTRGLVGANNASGFRNYTSTLSYPYSSGSISCD